jgi:hypothetical protein
LTFAARKAGQHPVPPAGQPDPFEHVVDRSGSRVAAT